MDMTEVTHTTVAQVTLGATKRIRGYIIRLLRTKATYSTQQHLCELKSIFRNYYVCIYGSFGIGSFHL
jgi:hypothetical protein